LNVVDVLVVGLVLLGGLRGYSRGLITGVANFLAGIAGFAIAALEYAKVLAWAEQHFHLQSWLEPQVFRLIWPLVQAQAKNPNGQVLGGITRLAPDLSSGLPGGNIPGLSSVVQGVLQQVGHRLAGIVTENILRLVAFGVVFYAVVLAARIVLAVLLKPLGILGGGLNRGGGFFFGALSSAVGLAVLVGIVSPVLPLGFGGSFGGLIQHSLSYPYLLGLFHVLDNLLSTQLTQKLLAPFALDKLKAF